MLLQRDVTGDRVRPRGASRPLWLSSSDARAVDELLPEGGVLLYPRQSRRWRWGVWIRRAAPWLLPTVVAALLVFPSLSDTPGIHGDEAWILRRVRELSAGTRPADGMTLYTGALHQYLVWPFVAVLGETVWAVRLPGTLMALVAIAMLTTTLRRPLGDGGAALCGVLLATSPALVLFARFGIELTALSLFLTVVSLAAFARIGDGSGARDFALAQVGGLALGLLVYNHVVALPVPLALAAVAVAAGRGRLLRSPVLAAALFGFALGCLPRIVDLMHPERRGGWQRSETLLGSLAAAVADLPTVPILLLRCWDGAWLYRRFAGGGTVPVVPYTLAALLVVAVLRVRSRTWPSGPGVAAVVTTALAAVGTCLLAPHLALRYFVVVHAAIPVLFGLALTPLLAAGKNTRRAALGIAGGVMALNIFYLWVNIAVPFARSGGGLLTFPIGRRLTESSNHFVRTDGLYAALRSAGVKRVDAEVLIIWCLQAHDRAGALSFGMPAEGDHRQQGHGRTAYVTYDTPGAPGPSELQRGGLTFKRALTEVPMFRIYLSPP